MPPRFVAPAAPKCPRCTKSVYSAEQIIGPNGAAWHKACYTCRECNRRLDSNILAEHEGEAYCKTCHKKMWGPTGYGYASGLLVREDPESQFKQSIGRPPNSAGSQNNDNDNDNTNTNSGSYATLDEVVYNNTGGSNRSAGREYHDNNSNSGETEEERRERLTPVNATLKKRSSLDMIREQAEASRRAYDEAHNQRIANKYGKVTTNSTGGSTASVGSRSDLHLGGSGSHLHAQSGYISAGSDTSSAFGSTKATTSSPAPSFSSISSTASSQPATKSLFLNQSYRTTSSASTASHQDAESDYARSRQALNFQTGAPAPVSSGPPSLPKRAPEPVVEPVRDTTPTQQYQDEQRAADDDFEDYMPIRVVARKEEAAPAPAPTAASAVEEDEWDAAPTQKQPEQPIYRSQYLRQQDKREQEQREQAQREQEYLDRARAASSAASAPVSSSSTSSVSSTPTSSARLNRLISETDKLTLKEQEQRHAQPASTAAASGDVDEWDEDPTPTMPSKPQNLSYSAARNVSPAATRTWTPTANTASETTSQPSNTNHSRISSAELNSPTTASPVNSQPTTTPKTSYYRSGGLMTPKKMTTSFGGGGDICPRCQKTVYHAESALAPGGAKYHKLCLRCVECSKSLDSTNMTDRQGTPYCKACYSKAWGAKGYGYGSGASMLHTEL